LLLLRKKADSSGKAKWRAVIDFRKLNEWTVGYAYPLPNINDILDELEKAKFFSTVDLNQVQLFEKVSAKSEFGMPSGHFEFFRFSMGLKPSPATFQYVSNSELAGMNGLLCFCSMDVVIITA
jgi:hypothetical protein